MRAIPLFLERAMIEELERRGLPERDLAGLDEGRRMSHFRLDQRSNRLKPNGAN